MKYIFVWIAISALLIIFVPLCLNVAFVGDSGGGKTDEGTGDIDVYFALEDKVKTMSEEDYILGVLMAEMPAEFEVEALKAQAVAARTYMWEKVKNPDAVPMHNGGEICTDSSHCQAYISIEEAKNKWGKNASLYLKKCKNAVKETQGIIAVYENEPIKAVFHAYASGRTEDAEDVWGSEVAYLKSVESPGDELAPKFETEVEVSLEDFKEKLASKYGVDFSERLIGGITRSNGGAVSEIEVGNKSIKGTEIRTLFGLRSASFDIIPCEKSVVFKVKGYGHGVGMSQYGANYCAKQGMDYREILCKYYSGIDFASISKE